MNERPRKIGTTSGNPAYRVEGFLSSVNPTTPKALSTLMELANTQIQMKNYDDAKATFLSAMSQFGDSPKPYVEFGRLLTFLGETTEALKYVTIALDLSPQSSDAYCARGEISEVSAEFLDAITWYKTCLELEASSSRGRLRMGTSWMKLRNYPEAIYWLHSISDIPGYAALANYCLGRSYWELGGYEAAEACLTRAVFLAPHNDSFRTVLEQFLSRKSPKAKPSRLKRRSTIID